MSIIVCVPSSAWHSAWHSTRQRMRVIVCALSSMSHLAFLMQKMVWCFHVRNFRFWICAYHSLFQMLVLLLCDFSFFPNDFKLWLVLSVPSNYPQNIYFGDLHVLIGPARFKKYRSCPPPSRNKLWGVLWSKRSVFFWVIFVFRARYKR